MKRKISSGLYETGSHYLTNLCELIRDYRNGKEIEDSLKYVEKYREALRKFKKELILKDPEMNFLVLCADEFIALTTKQGNKRLIFKDYDTFKKADQKNPNPMWRYIQEYTFKVKSNYDFKPHIAWMA
ncbi:MAG: hypothetical protein AB1333_03210 [Patescibacteria group bacterium]